MTDREIVSLREYFEERFRLHEEHDRERWKQHFHVHLRERDQLQLASKVQDERLTHMNEFRDQINTERSNYITRSEVMWAFGTAIMVAGIAGSLVTKLLMGVF